jgi:hypothetical protein
VSETPESASGSPYPAANQASNADDPDSGAPRPDSGKESTLGGSRVTEDAGAQGGSATPQDDATPNPGDSAGVTVNSADSLLGSSESSQPIQSTGEMVTEEARQRAAHSEDPDSAAPGDSALPPE